MKVVKYVLSTNCRKHGHLVLDKQFEFYGDAHDDFFTSLNVHGNAGRKIIFHQYKRYFRRTYIAVKWGLHIYKE